jgi:hypothetical protein
LLDARAEAASGPWLAAIAVCHPEQHRVTFGPPAGSEGSHVPPPPDVPALLAMSSDELDELFRESPAGEIPDGDAEGTVLIVPGTSVSTIKARFLRFLAWRGKVFNRAQGDLRNKVGPFGLKAVRAKVYKQASWFDGQETIVLDYSKTSFVARKVRDEIREVAPHLYLGLVFWERDKVLHFALQFPA